jgi:hypothetical protein
MKRAYVLILAVLLFTPVLTAQQTEPRADRLTEMLKTDVFRLGLLLQSEAAFSFNDDSFNGGRSFNMGATRLDMRGVVDNNFTYRVQVDFGRQVSILDAQVGYLFNENHRFVAGSFKPAISRDLDPSPGDTDFMNRARQVGAMMNSREIGVTFLGEPGNLSYRFGIYNGTGLTRANDNRFMYTGRLDYNFDFDVTRLKVGLIGVLNQTRMTGVGNTGMVSEGDRLLYGAFFDLESGPVFAVVEYLQTKFDAFDFGGREETIDGFYGTFGVNVSDKDQVLARWDYLGFDLADRQSDLITFGWNHQATRLISFQVNLLALLDDDTDDTQMGLSAVMQFQF